jgi:hypothetical protein
VQRRTSAFAHIDVPNEHKPEEEEEEPIASKG